jgi:hypothetical protein
MTILKDHQATLLTFAAPRLPVRRSTHQGPTKSSTSIAYSEGVARHDYSLSARNITKVASGNGDEQCIRTPDTATAPNELPQTPSSISCNSRPPISMLTLLTTLPPAASFDGPTSTKPDLRRRFVPHIARTPASLSRLEARSLHSNELQSLHRTLF